MLNRVAVFSLFIVTTATLLAQEPKDDRLTPFILDNMTLVAENGERIISREDYVDIIKKDIKILREYDEQIIKFKFKILDYGSFKVLFDRKCKVRDIYITEPGPELLNGIRIGEPLENFLEDFKHDPRYRIEIFDEYSVLYIYFTEFKPNWDEGFDPEPIILVKYDEERRVSYINAGFDWP